MSNVAYNFSLTLKAVALLLSLLVVTPQSAFAGERSEAARKYFDSKLRSDYTRFMGLPEEGGEIHHAIELRVLDDHPDVFTARELNEFENMRGILPENRPNETLKSGYKTGGKRKLHASVIRRWWNATYKELDAAIEAAGLQPEDPEYRNFVRSKLISERDNIDRRARAQFSKKGRYIQANRRINLMKPSPARTAVRTTVTAIGLSVVQASFQAAIANASEAEMPTESEMQSSFVDNAEMYRAILGARFVLDALRHDRSRLEEESHTFYGPNQLKLIGLALGRGAMMQIDIDDLLQGMLEENDAIVDELYDALNVVNSVLDESEHWLAIAVRNKIAADALDNSIRATLISDAANAPPMVMQQIWTGFRDRDKNIRLSLEEFRAFERELEAAIEGVNRMSDQIYDVWWQEIGTDQFAFMRETINNSPMGPQPTNVPTQNRAPIQNSTDHRERTSTPNLGGSTNPTVRRWYEANQPDPNARVNVPTGTSLSDPTTGQKDSRGRQIPDVAPDGVSPIDIHWPQNEPGPRTHPGQPTDEPIVPPQRQPFRTSPATHADPTTAKQMEHDQKHQREAELKEWAERFQKQEEMARVALTKNKHATREAQRVRAEIEVRQALQRETAGRLTQQAIEQHAIHAETQRQLRMAEHQFKQENRENQIRMNQERQRDLRRQSEAATKRAEEAEGMRRAAETRRQEMERERRMQFDRERLLAAKRLVLEREQRRINDARRARETSSKPKPFQIVICGQKTYEECNVTE